MPTVTWARVDPARRAAIIEAAEAEFGAHGFSGGSLNVIARRAGVAKGSLFQYFADKRDLLVRLAADVSEQLYGQADVFFSGAGDPAQQVREALTNVSGLYREHGTLIRAIVEVSTYEEDIAVFWRGLLDRFVDATQRRIEAERSGDREYGDARATAFALTWMVERTFYQQLVQHEPVDTATLIDALVAIYLGTL